MKFDRFPSGPKRSWHQQALDICSGQKNVSRAELPGLLGWLRDYNWPGAHRIACFLDDKVDAILPSVRSILTESSDIGWKYWIIVSLILQWKRADVAQLRPALLEIAEGSDEAEAHVVALEALIKHDLIDPIQAKTLLKHKMEEFPGLEEDLHELFKIVDRE